MACHTPVRLLLILLTAQILFYMYQTWVRSSFWVCFLIWKIKNSDFCFCFSFSINESFCFGSGFGQIIYLLKILCKSNVFRIPSTSICYTLKKKRKIWKVWPWTYSWYSLFRLLPDCIKYSKLCLYSSENTSFCFCFVTEHKLLLRNLIYNR